MNISKQNSPAFGAVFVKFPPKGLNKVSELINETAAKTGKNYDVTGCLRGQESCVFKVEEKVEGVPVRNNFQNDTKFADILKESGLDVWV